jgi:hypothetical protein
MYGNAAYKCTDCGANLDPSEKCDCKRFIAKYTNDVGEVNYLQKLIEINKYIDVSVAGNKIYVEFPKCEVYTDQNYLCRVHNVFGCGDTLNSSCRDYYNKISGKALWWR